MPVKGRKSAVIPWKWVVAWCLRKNHIELERGSKLLGTSSEALWKDCRQAKEPWFLSIIEVFQLQTWLFICPPCLSPMFPWFNKPSATLLLFIPSPILIATRTTLALWKEECRQPKAPWFLSVTEVSQLQHCSYSFPHPHLAPRIPIPSGKQNALSQKLLGSCLSLRSPWFSTPAQPSFLFHSHPPTPNPHNPSPNFSGTPPYLVERRMQAAKSSLVPVCHWHLPGSANQLQPCFDSPLLL